MYQPVDMNGRRRGGCIRVFHLKLGFRTFCAIVLKHIRLKSSYCSLAIQVASLFFSKYFS